MKNEFVKKTLNIKDEIEADKERVVVCGGFSFIFLSFVLPSTYMLTGSFSEAALATGLTSGVSGAMAVGFGLRAALRERALDR